MSIRVERLLSAAICQLPHAARVSGLTHDAVVKLHTRHDGQGVDEGTWGHYRIHDIYGFPVFQHMGEQGTFVLSLMEGKNFVPYSVRVSHTLAMVCTRDQLGFITKLIKIIREVYPHPIEQLAATA